MPLANQGRPFQQDVSFFTHPIHSAFKNPPPDTSCMPAKLLLQCEPLPEEMEITLFNWSSQNRLTCSPNVLRSKNKNELLRNLVEESEELEIRYNAAQSQLCDHLLSLLKNTAKQVEHMQMSAFLEACRPAANILIETGKQLHMAYIAAGKHCEKVKLAKELYRWEMLLGVKNSIWRIDVSKSSHIKFMQQLSSSIRNGTASSNGYRLFLLRLKKMFVTLMPLMKSVAYQNFIQQIEMINPFLNHLAWIFYLPRLAINLIGLFQLLIPIQGLYHQEKTLGFISRLKAYWRQTWAEIFNDSVWFVFGLANCFFLSITTSMSIAVALYFFDVALAYIKADLNNTRQKNILSAIEKTLTELKKELDSLEKELNALCDKDGPINLRTKKFLEAKIKLDKKNLDLYANYRDSIIEWCEFEKHQLKLSIEVKCGLAASMTLTLLPIIFSLSPATCALLSAISATAMVLICIWDYYKKNQVQKLRPVNIDMALQQLELIFLENGKEDKESQALTENNLKSTIPLHHPHSSVSCPPTNCLTSTNKLTNSIGHVRAISNPATIRFFHSPKQASKMPPLMPIPEQVYHNMANQTL